LKAKTSKKLRLFLQTALKNGSLLKIDVNFHQYTNFPRRAWLPEAQSALPPGATFTAW
jgi:hypothetical protein